jgi:hypothetical protein
MFKNIQSHSEEIWIEIESIWIFLRLFFVVGRNYDFKRNLE